MADATKNDSEHIDADGEVGADAAAPQAEQNLFSALPDLRQTLNDTPDPASASLDTNRDEFTTVYDIIDRLEETIGNAKSMLLFPGQVRVDRDDVTGQLDTLKSMLPVQLERASALMREAEHRLDNAQSQASAIVASAQSRSADVIKEAQDQAQFLAGQENVTDLARQQATAIVEQAQAKANRLTSGADEYCTRVMQGLQEQLDRLNADVKGGLRVLADRTKAASQDLAASRQDPRADEHKSAQ